MDDKGRRKLVKSIYELQSHLVKQEIIQRCLYLAPR